MVGGRLALLAPARQSRPRPAAHDGPAGGAAADGRDLSGRAVPLAAAGECAAGGGRGQTVRDADPGLLTAPSGKALAGADLARLPAEAVFACVTAVEPLTG